MDRLARIMEFFWLTLAVVGALWAGWEIHVLGWPNGKLYLWFPLICCAMFLYRRFTRRKMAEWARRKAAEQQGDRSA